MASDKKTQTMRYEPVGAGVVRRPPITERNLASSVEFPDDDADTFGTVSPNVRDSAIVVAKPKRDRTPKGVNDGRGKRSVEDMLHEMPSDAHRATYAMERIASLEDQISRILDLCTKGAREIIFTQRKSLRHYYEK